MNILAERILVTSRRYVGPAAPAFLRRELAAVSATLDTLSARHLPDLAAHAEKSAARLMDGPRAAEFAAALLACGNGLVPAAGAPVARGQEALDAAAALARDGKLMKAELAYREIIAGGGGAAAHLGLARTAFALDDPHRALVTLRDGAVRLTRAGDRAGAIDLLKEAVRIAPLDHPAHRHLAAAHANAGDMDAARGEYVRFVELALQHGDARRAELEIAYARDTLGDHPAVLALDVSLRSQAEPSSAFDEAQDPGLVAARREAVAQGTDGPAAAAAAASLPTSEGGAQAMLDDAVTPGARALLAERKLYAASDMLLEYIGRGGNERDAQLLLIEVASAIGLADDARDKGRLLAAAYRLDGSEQLATGVEALAASA
ncbi:MAG: hypothetical protein M3O91_03055 [Chloroflexota bacterium]|nr:hypothetical protein [Chloroflexota bacterium]